MPVEIDRDTLQMVEQGEAAYALIEDLDLEARKIGVDVDALIEACCGLNRDLLVAAITIRKQATEHGLVGEPKPGLWSGKVHRHFPSAQATEPVPDEMDPNASEHRRVDRLRREMPLHRGEEEAG